MTFPGRLAFIAACLAAGLALVPAARSADSVSKLRKEKARLTEMKQKAEKAAAELAETIRREKSTRSKVDDLQAKLARQRRSIARIDKRLLALGGQVDRAERDVRALEEERGKSQRGLAAATAGVFAGELERPGAMSLTASSERRRYFARRVLANELARYGRLTADKEEKERILSGIERKREDSERRMAEQKKVGEKLASRQEAERQRLSEIEKKKKEKARELRALRARIGRMEALVSRIERQVRQREPRKQGPSRFSGIPGGLVAPLEGKVVGRFGKQLDPVFDVVVENRGVEIEAESGAAIRAVGGGEVVFAGGVSGFGKVLIIQHGSGLFSVYGKAETFSVNQGRKVTAGEPVGKLPANPGGKSVLYLELRAAGTAIDPATLIHFSR
ncbi:MAG: murein hydrolase activator EnvC family protein [Deltaproteobacteria bacterium]